ncbi:hypothetical protein SprV_0602066500 [Sparganum proliferum]
MTDYPDEFWSCRLHYYISDAMDSCAFILESFGFIANLAVTVLLFLLRAKKAEGLALLRVLSFSCLAFEIISFADDISTHSAHTGNTFFDGLICILWNTRFLFWYAIAHVYHSFFFFACNRVLELLQVRKYFIVTEKQRLAVFKLLVFTCSFFSAAPQLLLAQPHAEDCACASPTGNFVILTVIYAHAYLWIAVFGLIYPTVLVCICTLLVLRLRRSEGDAVVDELDHLHFPNPLPSSSSTTASTHPVTSSSQSFPSHRQWADSVATVTVPHVWSASFCILPLTAVYIAAITFEATHQFLSAAGIFRYNLRSPAQRFSGILMNLFAALVPMILFFHIPAMRSLIFVAIEFAQRRCRKIRFLDTGHSESQARIVPDHLTS